MTTTETRPTEGLSSSLEIHGEAGIYVLDWQALHVRIDHLAEDKRSVSAEFTFNVTGGLPWTTRCNMVSDRSKDGVARKVEQRCGVIEGEKLIEAICQAVLLRHRAGAPVVALDSVEEPPPLAYLLRPLVVAHHPVLIYGDGGTGKSTAAAWLSLLAQHGLNYAGVAANGGPVNVLYQDYEATAEDVGRTMARLWRGMGREGRPAVFYRRGSQPLTHDADQVRRILLDNKVEWMIIDSAVGALQGDMNSPTDVGMFYAAVRTFNVGVLILAHTQKAGEHKTPLGSGQWWNQAREVYEMAAAPGPGNSLTAALYHRKANYRRKLPPWGLRFDFGPEDNDAADIVVSRTDVTIVPELAEKLRHHERIAGVLKRGKMTVAEIAAILGIAGDLARNTLNRYPHLFGQDETARPPKWFLLAPGPQEQAENEPF